MKTHRKSANGNGQSIVEVIVATAVILLLATGLVAGTSAALRASISSRARSESTKLVAEGLEIARNDRDKGWSTFQGRSTGAATSYCLGQNDTSFLGLTPESDPANNCAQFTLGSVRYRRWGTFDWEPAATPPYMIVTLTVNWREGSATRNSHATVYLTQWK